MSMRKRKLRVVEIYAGTGRSVEPYRARPGYEVALLADVSRKARDVYLANHEGAPYRLIDLSTASPEAIEREAGGRVDILLGCPPCQGFSDSGRRQADDPRNDHIVKFGEMIEGLRPMGFAMENVPLAAVSEQFARFARIVGDAGYEMAAGVLNAAEYGSAQTRQRLVVVGRRGNGSGVSVSLPAPTHAPIGCYFDYNRGALRDVAGSDPSLLGVTTSHKAAVIALGSARMRRGTLLRPTPNVVQTIGDLPAVGTPAAAALAHIPFRHSQVTLDAMDAVPPGGRRETGRIYFGAAYARLHQQGLAKTLTRYFSNPGSGRFWHPVENRSLTIREAARLQGFEDGFEFRGGATEANTWMIGNALDRSLADVSFRALRRII